MWETLQRKHLETIDTSCICRLLPIITHLILEPENMDKPWKTIPQVITIYVVYNPQMVLLAPHPNQWIQHDPAPSTMKSWQKYQLPRENGCFSVFFAYHFTGWWYTYPSEKYESQLGLLFPTYGKIKHLPNHQPLFYLSDFPTLQKTMSGTWLFHGFSICFSWDARHRRWSHSSSSGVGSGSKSL